jgi:FAD:protein FMN transferase
MGMPISLALRGRHASSDAAEQAWEAVIKQLREVDLIFSTYRHDSIINRLDRGELLIDECPPEVAEVLDLGDKPSDGRTARSRSTFQRPMDGVGLIPAES